MLLSAGDPIVVVAVGTDADVTRAQFEEELTARSGWVADLSSETLELSTEIVSVGVRVVTP